MELYVQKDADEPDDYNGVASPPRARHSGGWGQVGLRKHCY